MFLALLLAAPAGLWLALAARERPARSEEFPAALERASWSADQALALAPARQAHAAQAAQSGALIAARVKEVQGQFVLAEVQSPIIEPDLLAYALSSAPLGTELPAGSWLLGAIGDAARGRCLRLALPEAFPPGELWLAVFSLAHGEIVASVHVQG